MQNLAHKQQGFLRNANGKGDLVKLPLPSALSLEVSAQRLRRPPIHRHQAKPLYVCLALQLPTPAAGSAARWPEKALCSCFPKDVDKDVH